MLFLINATDDKLKESCSCLFYFASSEKPVVIYGTTDYRIVVGSSCEVIMLLYQPTQTLLGQITFLVSAHCSCAKCLIVLFVLGYISFMSLTIIYIFIGFLIEVKSSL